MLALYFGFWDGWTPGPGEIVPPHSRQAVICASIHNPISFRVELVNSQWVIGTIKDFKNLNVDKIPVDGAKIVEETQLISAIKPATDIVSNITSNTTLEAKIKEQ